MSDAFDQWRSMPHAFEETGVRGTSGEVLAGLCRKCGLAEAANVHWKSLDPDLDVHDVLCVEDANGIRYRVERFGSKVGDRQRWVLLERIA